MFHRYVIRWERNKAVALRYDLRNGDTMVGGSRQHFEEVEMLLREYFGITEHTARLLSGGKVRCDFHLSWTRFRKGRDRMKENHLLEPVKSHARILR